MGIKKKSYKGLDVLERGRSTFVSGKGDEAKQKGYAENKRKNAYAKLLEKEGYQPLNFEDNRKDDQEEWVEVGPKKAGKKQGAQGVAQCGGGRSQPRRARRLP